MNFVVLKSPFAVDQPILDSDAILNQRIENRLSKLITGQEHVIKYLSEQLPVSQSGFDPEGFRAVHLFGLSGHGKTETARAISAVTGWELRRFDFSLVNSKEDTSRIVGSATGLVGSDQGKFMSGSFFLTKFATKAANVSTLFVA